LSEARDPVPGAEAHRFHLGTFEGPLDLLLHLVRVNELDIRDLPIAEIARQYDDYLAMMREMNLEVAGDYLVMAATLVHIKSRMLLPQEPVHGEEAEAAPDPRTELVQQLLEYQRYKQAAENLQAMDSVRSLIWTREGGVPQEFAEEEMLAVDLFDLLSAFRKLLSRLDQEAQLRFGREDVSVADKIAWLQDLVDRQGFASFDELILSLPTRIERIATFLAVLEMVRLQWIVCLQSRQLGEIRLVRRQDVPSAPADLPPPEPGPNPPEA
jgi:segregation and condensation protein A